MPKIATQNNKLLLNGSKLWICDTCPCDANVTLLCSNCIEWKETFDVETFNWTGWICTGGECAQINKTFTVTYSHESVDPTTGPNFINYQWWKSAQDIYPATGCAALDDITCYIGISETYNTDNCRLRCNFRPPGFDEWSAPAFGDGHRSDSSIVVTPVSSVKCSDTLITFTPIIYNHCQKGQHRIWPQP